MGAVPYPGGTMFRVWAPNAEQVYVAGDFNGGSEVQDRLTAEGGGMFVACVPAARPGHRYRYVLHHQGKVMVKADPRARAMTASNGSSVVVDLSSAAGESDRPGATTPSIAFAPPAPNEQIVYELHIGTFNDLPGGRPGTFRSAIDRLEHLATLGVNTIELLPIAEFAGDFSWGYNPAFPFAPESAYGSPADLRALIDAAHRRGIGVIIDVVHNHWGPQDLAMWCFDGPCLGAGGIYFYTDWRRETAWGPRPDFGRSAVRDYIRDNALLWLGEYGADGLRWDSTVNIRSHDGGDIPDGWRLLREINETVHMRWPNKIQIAEDLQRFDAITASPGSGGAGFDAQWDPAFVHPVNAAVIAVDDSARNMASIRDALQARFNGAPFRRVIFTESHDEVANGKKRIPEMIDPARPDSLFARKRSSLGAALALTAPGVPMLFQGQELLEQGSFRDTVPVDWSRADRFPGIFALYRDLVHLRRNLAGQTRGLLGPHINVFHLNERDKVIAYHRWRDGGPGDDVVVVASLSNRPFARYQIGLPRGGRWKVRFDSDALAYGPDHGGSGITEVDAVAAGRDGLAFTGDVVLGAYSAVILSQER